MAEYYVVRDKNTGLYFRGKGVNRWGKYYNQASIYRIRANAENTIKEVSWRGEQAEVVPIQIIETTADVVPKIEVAALKIELEAMRTAANAYKMHYEKAKSEVERLHGILLQFTDIVHKWGAKNNIDTSEISLVPILQEEAALLAESKCEVAIEIIQDIAKACAPHDHHLNSLDFEIGYITAMNQVIAQLEEIKKKYTEEGGLYAMC